MCAHRLSLVQSLRGGKDHGAAIQSGDLRDLNSERICALPGCSIGMCTLLFGYNITLFSSLIVFICLFLEKKLFAFLFFVLFKKKIFFILFLLCVLLFKYIYFVFLKILHILPIHLKIFCFVFLHDLIL
jgi:hypothetical protein